jgi:hypothetical protein
MKVPTGRHDPSILTEKSGFGSISLIQSRLASIQDVTGKHSQRR